MFLSPISLISAQKALPWEAEHLSEGQLSGTKHQGPPLGNPPDNSPRHLPRIVSSHPTQCHALCIDDPRNVSLALTYDHVITWLLSAFLRASFGLQGQLRCPWLRAFLRLFRGVTSFPSPLFPHHTLLLLSLSDLKGLF